MSHQLVSHNDDIRRLVEKGYAVAFDELNYLIVRDVPYLDERLDLRTGAIVAKFVDTGGNRIVQHDHQVFFAGGVPHGLDGRPVPNMGGGATPLALSEASSDVVVERSFSNKPKGGSGTFRDFFDKIESYVTLISGPAINNHDATPWTFRQVEDGPSDSPFKFRDTLTSRAEIGDLSAKLREDTIAIIGLGGTGAYLLDLMVKSPVRQIVGFDPDLFHVHNAFRSPGGLDPNELNAKKAEVFQARYESFRHRLNLRDAFVDATSLDDLNGVTFAFVCVDKGSSRAGIFDLLIKLNIPFIDVGMGLARTPDGALGGMLRATYFSTDRAPATRAEGHAPVAEDPDDLYHNNIQIGELNALNACLAMIMFKQIRGFYSREDPFYHLLFEVGGMKAYRKSCDGPD